MYDFLFTYAAFLRHCRAENSDAKSRYLAGEKDAYAVVKRQPSHRLELVPEGLEEARIAGEMLRMHGLTFTQHVSSPMKRAMQTAEALSISGAVWTTDHRFSEMDHGVLEGLNPDELRAALKQVPGRHDLLDGYRYCPEDGESFLHLERRVRPAVLDLSAGRPLVVCHSGVMRLIDRILFGGMSSRDFGPYIDSKNRIPHRTLFEYECDPSGVWHRRVTTLSEGNPLGTWEPIVRPTYSGDDLGRRIAEVRARRDLTDV